MIRASAAPRRAAGTETQHAENANGTCRALQNLQRRPLVIANNGKKALTYHKAGHLAPAYKVRAKARTDNADLCLMCTAMPVFYYKRRRMTTTTG